MSAPPVRFVCSALGASMLLAGVLLTGCLATSPLAADPPPPVGSAPPPGGPGLTSGLADRALKAFIAKSYRESWAFCDQLLAREPDHALGHALRAASRIRFTPLDAPREIALVLEDAARAVALAPDMDLAHAQQGWVLLLAGRFAEARTPTRKAMALAPDNWAWRVNMGHVLLLTGQDGPARQQYAAAFAAMKGASRADAELIHQEVGEGFALFITRGLQPERVGQARAWFEARYRELLKADQAARRRVVALCDRGQARAASCPRDPAEASFDTLNAFLARRSSPAALSPPAVSPGQSE